MRELRGRQNRERDILTSASEPYLSIHPFASRNEDYHGVPQRLPEESQSELGCPLNQRTLSGISTPAHNRPN